MPFVVNCLPPSWVTPGNPPAAQQGGARGGALGAMSFLFSTSPSACEFSVCGRGEGGGGEEGREGGGGGEGGRGEGEGGREGWLEGEGGRGGGERRREGGWEREEGREGWLGGVREGRCYNLWIYVSSY